MARFSPILLAVLLPLAVRAANDWTKPCFGECNWDITSETGSGTVRLVGANSAVSDLTTAAGWTILNCDANTADQDIRVVCHDPSMGCDHLDLNGAEGTIVRLPNSCGSMPFALVKRKWVHKDQSIPASKRSLLVRRDGEAPTVKGIALATDFASVDPAQNGNVTLFVQGSSIPGVAGNFTQTPPSGQLAKRGFLSWVKNTLKDISEIHKEISGSSPINFDDTVPLFNQSFDCPQNGNIPAFAGSASVDLTAKVNGTVNYGVAATGSIIPPKVDEFGLFVGVDTDIVGTLGLHTTLTGSISSPKLTLFETGIPGLDFPKILSIGPTFSVNALATAALDANLDIDVGLVYTVSGAKLFFPPSDSAPGGAFTPGDSSLKLAVSPNVTSHGQVAAHLIPELAFGIDALDGVAKATISLDFDASAGIDLSLTAAASASASTDGSKDASASFGGCVDVNTGLQVSAGADASFLGLFDKSTSVDLFKKTFDLFKKCFGSSAARRAYTGRKGRDALLAKRDSVGCPSNLLSSAVSIAEEVVSSSSLQGQ